MEDYLAPAVVVALFGIIVQGIKAGLDLYDRKKAREVARRQSNIALCVALMQLADAMGHTPGRILETKKMLVTELLLDTLSTDVLGVFGLHGSKKDEE